MSLRIFTIGKVFFLLAALVVFCGSPSFVFAEDGQTSAVQLDSTIEVSLSSELNGATGSAEATVDETSEVVEENSSLEEHDNVNSLSDSGTPTATSEDIILTQEELFFRNGNLCR